MIVEIILIFATLIKVWSYEVDASSQNIYEVVFTVDILSKKT